MKGMKHIGWFLAYLTAIRKCLRANKIYNLIIVRFKFAVPVVSSLNSFEKLLHPKMLDKESNDYNLLCYVTGFKVETLCNPQVK